MTAKVSNPLPPSHRPLAPYTSTSTSTKKKIPTANNNGGTTDYYAIPPGAKTLNDLIEYKNMTFAQGEIFKAIYAFNERAARATDGSSSKLREANKVLYYAQRIVKQLQPKLRIKLKVKKDAAQD